MEQIAVALLVWIAAHSPYDVAHLAPPPIVLLSPEAMTAKARGGDGDAALHHADPRVMGYYTSGEGSGGTIYLVRPQDTPGAERYADPADNPLFRERLLHELVHFAQHATGEAANYRCPTQGEYRAYQLGGRYLDEQGVRDPMPQRLLVARWIAQC